MDKETFESLRTIIYRESGIVLPPEKMPLLSARIQKRLLALNVPNEAEYLRVIELDVDGAELSQLIDAISTNVTHFYREQNHFEILKKILTQWSGSGKREFKIWCAAASSGEEPYTIAFECADALDLRSQAVKILATDICSKVLHKATLAKYPVSALEKIPSPIRQAYIQPVTEQGKNMWEVAPQVKALVTFKKLNLVKFPFPLRGPIDIIFCRNVMIYFDVPTRAKIIKEFERLLAPQGYLFLSHSENLIGIDTKLKKVGASVFQQA